MEWFWTGLAPAARGSIRRAPETYVFDHVRMPAEFVAEFRDIYRLAKNAFAAANANGTAAEMERELFDLLESQNTSRTAARTVIPATFLLSTVWVG
jgi:hypothetical protein